MAPQFIEVRFIHSKDLKLKPDLRHEIYNMQFAQVAEYRHTYNKLEVEN